MILPEQLFQCSVERSSSSCRGGISCFNMWPLLLVLALLVDNYLHQDLLRKFVTWDLGYHLQVAFVWLFNSFILLFLFLPLCPSTNKICLPYLDYWILANLVDICQLRCRNINPHSTITSIPTFLDGNQLFLCLFTAKNPN